jgi:ATP-dependent Clp protease ATP-binding subunit ClpA
MTMFERFTDQARSVVIAAKTKAAEHGDDQILPVHMLYGLTATEGLAATVLAPLGADAAAVERELDRMTQPGRAVAGDQARDDAEALAVIGIDLEEIKRKVEEGFGPGALDRVPPIPRGPLSWTGRLPFSDQAKLTLAFSLREARVLRHGYIGTEHVLLGLLRVAERDPRGEFAAITLRDPGIDPGQVRQRVLDELRHAPA